jgi:hypothetical protein
MCVPTKIGVFFWVLRWPTPAYFQGFYNQWCNKIPLIYHHLEDMGGVKFQGGRIDEGKKRLIMIHVESFEVTYPFIFKCFKANGGVIFA